MRPIRLAIALALSALPLTLGAQFHNRTLVSQDGIRWMVLPVVSIETTQRGNVVVLLNAIEAELDVEYGMLVDGQRYAYSAFDGAIAKDLDALRVTALALRVNFDGVRECQGQLTLPIWYPGEAARRECEPGTDARLRDYRVNRVVLEGDLQAIQHKVRRLRDAAAAATPPA